MSTRNDTPHIAAIRHHAGTQAVSPALSRRHPSVEMRRQAQIAYAAALEILG